MSREHNEHMRALLARLHAPAGLPPTSGGQAFEAASGDPMRMVCFRIKAADKTQRISTLRLHDQDIRRTDDLELLCATLDGLTELDHLDLSGCTLFRPVTERGCWQPRERQARESLLCVLTKDRLRTLELRNTGMSDDAALALVNAVRLNTRLQALDLSCNGDSTVTTGGAKHACFATEEPLCVLWEQFHSRHGQQLAA